MTKVAKIYSWGHSKRYNDFSTHFRNLFNERVQKVSTTEMDQKDWVVAPIVIIPLLTHRIASCRKASRSSLKRESAFLGANTIR